MKNTSLEECLLRWKVNSLLSFKALEGSMNHQQQSRFSFKSLFCILWNTKFVLYHELLKPSETVTAKRLLSFSKSKWIFVKIQRSPHRLSTDQKNDYSALHFYSFHVGMHEKTTTKKQKTGRLNKETKAENKHRNE